MRRRLVIASALLALGLPGCGLVDPDITNFDLQVREKRFEVDTANWELGPVDQFTSIECGGAPRSCAVLPEDACGEEDQCAGRCGEDGYCELGVRVALWKEVDVDQDNPELRDIAEQPVIDVVIDAIEYAVIENTLNVATPEYTLYVAPSTIMSPDDPEALAIGTIPPVAAGTLVERTSVEITPEGRDALAAAMGAYQAPFNLIVGAELAIGNGDAVPTGLMSATVHVRAHAGL